MTKRYSVEEHPLLATPSRNPPAGSVLKYFKSDGLLYTKDSAGVETAVGTSNVNPGNLPVGSILMWPSGTAPKDYVISDGRALSRATYSTLFALIGTTYGVGDGSTTFNVPNFAGRSPMGLWSGGPYASALGVVGGEQLHYMTVNEMPSHDHAQNVLANGSAGSGQRIDYAGDRAFAGTFPQGVNTGATGGGAGFNVLDPYSTVNFIIRVSPSATADTETFQYFKGASPVLTATAYVSGANMDFSVRSDPSGSWSTTNKQWVCPQPGRYRITVALRPNSVVGRHNVMIFKNGVQASIGGDSANDAYTGLTHTNVLELLPGDTIAMRTSTNFTTNVDTGENTFMTIESVGLEGVPSGLTDSGWITLPYSANYIDYGSPPWRGGQYKKANNRVYLRGLVSRNTANAPAGSTLAALPVAFRPLQQEIFTVHLSGATGRVDINTNGGILHQDVLTVGGYLSLAGISFDII